jgi:hypothetical protein
MAPEAANRGRGYVGMKARGLLVVAFLDSRNDYFVDAVVE